MRERRVIGGLLGLPGVTGGGSSPRFLTGDGRCFVNGRSALGALYGAIQPRCVWVPSYLCRTLLVPLQQGRQRYEFFPVSGDLRVEPGAWLDRVSEGDVVLLIAYFGFPIEPGIVAEVRARGGRVVEDASQALLSGCVGHDGDDVLYSARKFVGVPDGAVMISRTPVVSSPRQPPPPEWWVKAFQACQLRRDFDLHGGDPRREWFKLFREVSAAMPCGPYAMSTLSESLIRTSFDYDAIARARRENFGYLLDGLKDIALYRELPEGVVPLGFPVCVADRARVQRVLYQEDIYPPVHWDLASVVPEEYAASHELSRRMLTLVCDQRYEAGDMKRTVESVRRALA